MKKLTLKVLLVAVLGFAFVGSVIASQKVNNNLVLELGGNLGGVENDPEPEVVYCDGIVLDDSALLLGGNLGGVENDPEPEVVYCEDELNHNTAILLGGNLGGVENDPEPEVVYCEFVVNEVSFLGL